jgi:hypothetical protein
MASSDVDSESRTKSHTFCIVPPFSNAESLNKVCHLIKEMAEGGTGQLSFFHVLGSPVMIQRAEAAGAGKRPFVASPKRVAGVEVNVLLGLQIAPV